MGDFRSDLPLGTDNPEVFYANVGNLDEAVTGRVALFWYDRKGVKRKTYFALEEDIRLKLLSLDFTEVPYVAGNTIDAQMQYVIAPDGNAYQVLPTTTLPYELTGDWATDSPNFMLMGDLSLRTELANENGAGMVGFKQLGVGAVTRTSLEKMRESVNIKDFGAKGDGVTDDSMAFKAAISYLQSIGGGELNLGIGTFLVFSEIEIKNTPITISGVSTDLSVILQGAAGVDLISFESTIETNRVKGWEGHGGSAISLRLKNLKLATKEKAGNAVNGVWESYSGNFPLLEIENVSIDSLENTMGGFKTGLNLTNCSSTRIENYRFSGDAGNVNSEGAYPYHSEAAIRLLATGTEGHINHFWSGLTLCHANFAVDIDGWYEGVYVTNFEFAFVGTALRVSGSGLPSGDVYVLEMVNGHFDFRESALKASRTWGVKLSQIDMIHSGATGNKIPGNLIEAQDSQYLTISKCSLHGTTFPDFEDAIVLKNVRNFDIDVDVYDVKGYAAWFSNSSGDAVVRSRNSGSGILISEGAFPINIKHVTLSGINHSSQGGNGFGVDIAEGVSNVRVFSACSDDSINLLIRNLGKGNRFYNCNGPHSDLFTIQDNSGVINSNLTGSKTFAVSNPDATVVNSISNGNQGETITLVFLNNNTTLVNQSGAQDGEIYLSGGSDFTPGFGNSIILKRIDSTWFEISRTL